MILKRDFLNILFRLWFSNVLEYRYGRYCCYREPYFVNVFCEQSLCSSTFYFFYLIRFIRSEFFVLILFLTTAWYPPKICQTTTWQMSEDCLTTVWQLSDDCHTTIKSWFCSKFRTTDYRFFQKTNKKIRPTYLWYLKLNCFHSFFGRIEDTIKTFRN